MQSGIAVWIRGLPNRGLRNRSLESQSGRFNDWSYCVVSRVLPAT